MLLKYTWEKSKGKGLEGRVAYESKEMGGVFIRDTDYALVLDPEFNAVVQRFASDERFFKKVFAKAWAKLMNADMFDGPTGNKCSFVFERT